MLKSEKKRIYAISHSLAVCLTFVMTFTSFASAISYFDIGFGVGPTWATLNNDNIGKKNDTALDFGLKIGGRFVNLGPNIYIVGELNGAIGTYWYDFDPDFDWGSSRYAQIASAMIGPGVIYYPKQFLQFGLSAGYSPIAYQDGWAKGGTKKGGAGNVSVALDLRELSKNIGGYRLMDLMGLKYYLSASNAYKSSTISIFFKYLYRDSN
ncbi:MAG: hypothetical protein LBU89_12775 [Fibromonadaceae bacterium]|jgi:hypothetical protein|nr:hypothetical protein [Fibromonadaceae bacterium]